MRPKKRRIKMWTRVYSPFVMGGSVWQPRYAFVFGVGPHDLGKGVKVYVVTAPNGKTKVVDSTTWGMVGDTLKQVQKDVDEADAKVIAKQFAEHKTEGLNARKIPAAEMWRMLKMQKRAA